MAAPVSGRGEPPRRGPPDRGNRARTPPRRPPRSSTGSSYRSTTRWFDAGTCTWPRCGRPPQEARDGREPPGPIQRYEWAQPGDLLHLDVTKLGRIGRVGHRITGNRRAQVRGIGLGVRARGRGRCLSLGLRGSAAGWGGVTMTQFVWRARAWFRRHGHSGAPSPTMRTNGKAGRFIHTLLREWAYRSPIPRRATARRRCPLGCTTTIGHAVMGRPWSSAHHARPRGDPPQRPTTRATARLQSDGGSASGGRGSSSETERA